MAGLPGWPLVDAESVRLVRPRVSGAARPRGATLAGGGGKPPFQPGRGVRTCGTLSGLELLPPTAPRGSRVRGNPGLLYGTTSRFA